MMQKEQRHKNTEISFFQRKCIILLHQKIVLFCQVAALWLGLWTTWMLFISKWDRYEAELGCLVAAFANIAIWLVKRKSLNRYSFHLQWFIKGVFIPKCVLLGAFEAFKAMVLQMVRTDQTLSFLQFVPFEVGSGEFSSEIRMALAIAYTTSTPNFVILGIDYKQGETEGKLIYHQLLKTPVPKMTQKLGAKP